VYEYRAAPVARSSALTEALVLSSRRRRSDSFHGSDFDLGAEREARMAPHESDRRVEICGLDDQDGREVVTITFDRMRQLGPPSSVLTSDDS
jgi:hypothetical protein